MRSPEEVTGLIRDALKAVGEADVPSALQPIAFSKAFDAIAGVVAQVPQGSDKSPNEGRGKPTTDTSTPLGKIAAALKVDQEDAADVFDIDGDELALTLRRDHLADERLDALHEIALLVVAGRQTGGLDDDRTHTDVVRAQGVELGVVRKNTFKDEMGHLGNVVTAKPSGRGRALKITRHGLNEAAELVTRITGSNT